jgi:type III restriction enzyme
METYWVPAVNYSAEYGRWAFAELTDVYEMEADFEAKVQSAVDQLIDSLSAQTAGEVA